MRTVNKRTVLVVITARPSYSRIKTVLQALSLDKRVVLKLVVTASALLDRYGNVAEVIEKDGFEIFARSQTVVEGDNGGSSVKTLALGLFDLQMIFESARPDVVVTVADRYETLATAICAAYLNIPLAHIQGGEVTGSIDEKVRHAVTKLSDIHFPSNSNALKRLINMGEREDKIFMCGCPSIDLARQTVDSPLLGSGEILKGSNGVGKPTDLGQKYLVVMFHPNTESSSEVFREIRIIYDVVSKLNIQVIWFWPNIDVGGDSIAKFLRSKRESDFNNNRVSPIYYLKNLEPQKFLALLIGSVCLVGNSSVGIRECSYLAVPVVNVGDRQRGRDRGANVIDVEFNRTEIEIAVKSQVNRNRSLANSLLYGDGFAGEKIADKLATVPLSITKQFQDI